MNKSSHLPRINVMFRSIKARFLLENWKTIILLIFLTCAFCYPIYHHRIFSRVDNDYGSHIQIAIDFVKTRQMDPYMRAHPILHYLLAFLVLASRSRLEWHTGLLIIQILAQVSTVLILYFWLGHSERNYWDWVRAGAAISLTFVAPILLPAIWDQKFYFGYIGMANYHNPTIHLLKPLGLLSMIFAIKAFNGKQARWYTILFSCGLLTLASWIKPNYSLVILPGLAIACMIWLLQKRSLDWKLVLFGFLIPGGINLLLQWLIAYYSGNPDGGITIAPFVVESNFSQYLFLKFCLSALFPLMILWMARKDLLKDSALLIGWVAFIVGVTQNYLLAEGGNRMFHGNFRWSGQIALFLLFAITLRWFLREKYLSNLATRWENIISLVVYNAHLLGGIAYYIYCMVSPHYG